MTARRIFPLSNLKRLSPEELNGGASPVIKQPVHGTAFDDSPLIDRILVRYGESEEDMSRDRYIEAIRALCNLLELRGAEEITEGAPLEIDDVLFSLLYGDRANPDAILGYCDFGEISPGKELDIYHSLLSINFIMYDGRGPSFTVSPETGRVILAMHFSLAGLKPQALLDRLTRVAGQAKEWRTHHPLTPPASFSASAPA